MDELSVSVDAAGVKAIYFDTVIRVVDWRWKKVPGMPALGRDFRESEMEGQPRSCLRDREGWPGWSPASTWLDRVARDAYIIL